MTKIITTQKIKKAISLMVLFFTILSANNNLKAQCSFTQLGIDIDGEADSDFSGKSVATSADGLTVAIGGIYNDGVGGNDIGHVRVYKNIGGTWVQQGADIDGETDYDYSGCSVAMSADGLTVAIGALYNDAVGGNNIGHVRVYKMINSTWVQQGADIDGEANGDYSGFSVAMSADGLIVAIGAPSNAGGGVQRGHVRVYKNIGGTWFQQGADINGEADNDESGRSVAISADGFTVVIGAPYNDGMGSYSGHVRVYKIINNIWVQQGADIDGEANDDQSGTSVAISADGLTVAIGAPRNDEVGRQNTGHVRVYKMINNTWVQQGADIDGEADVSYSGSSVAISANGLMVAIGAPSNSGGGTLRGHVRVYKNIGGTWFQQGADMDGEADNDNSGDAIAISADGSKVVIGALTNAGGGFRRGHVRVYELNCPMPKIAVNGNNVNIVKGDVTPNFIDSTNMGSTTSSLIRRYKIYNIGAATLNISSIVISGANASEFVISNIPTTLNVGDDASFTVTFTPTALGIRNATITINNNDTSAAAYDFAIQGTMIAPNITVKGNNVNIAKGDITPSLADSTDFGSTTTSIIRNYKIFNTGTATLNISSIVSSGANASEFVISNIPTAINVNDSAGFTVTFTPTTLATRNATITINSNDLNNTAYDFAIQGTKTSSVSVSSIKSSSEINIYPNPFNETLKVNLIEDKTATIFITDATGKIVLSQQIDNSTILNTTSLSAGIYTVNITTNTETKNVKLLKL